MKILSLNTWGGRAKAPFGQFLADHAGQVDIFCFQEVFKGATLDRTKDLTSNEDIHPQLFEEIQQLLPDHVGYFCPMFEDFFGLACFIKKDIKVVESGDVLLLEGVQHFDLEQPCADISRRMQWITIKNGDGSMMIVNHHGHWAPGDKSDNPESEEQTRIMIDFLSKSEHPKVLCGDFNLHPNTGSIKEFDARFKDLIKENNITTTRTSFFKWPQKFADYIFVSPELAVSSFAVLPEEVSDHVALMAEIG